MSFSTRRVWEPPWARGSGRRCQIRTTPSWPGPWPRWTLPRCRGWCRETTTAPRWTSWPASSPPGAAAIPYGTVSPEQATDPYAMIMSYRNFEDATIHGLDLSLAWYPADRWRLAGNYSFVDNNFFENLKFLHSEGGADVALNAPRHKLKLGADYDFAQWGLSAGGRVRYTGAFPMSSGVFVGEVDSYTVLDLNLAYRLPLEQDLVLRVEVSNLLGGTYQAFVGAPAVGRLVFAQLGCRF